MEEKRPGQTPEADREVDGVLQGRTARPGGRAAGGLQATAEDRALAEQADHGSEGLRAELKAGGFGDHKGTDGFPAIDRAE